ncbi:MAG: lactonase family protein [Armatimonadetes bacterium]|nr:lactonase family protein [Akkermansiaceae bacterium]
MKILPAFLISTLAMNAQPLYIGTGGQNDSKGIYLADFDSEKGTLTVPVLAAEYQSAGFLALHPEKPILYSIGEPKEKFPNGQSAIAAFTIGSGNSLTFLGEAPGGGNGNCHLAVDASGRTVTVANYGDGSFASIRLGPDGKPDETVTVVKNPGSGPNQQRQQEAHTHGVYFDNANRFLFVPDLGIDKVLIYKFDPATSELAPNTPADLKTAPGAGPRHMAFSPDEKHAYVINELDNTILAATFDSSTGGLTQVQTITTLPADFKNPNSTSEIEVHPTGDFVYGSNRGHDSIVAYQRDRKTGKLTLLQHAPCGGKTPRHFKIHPSGKWLLCAHQDSNTISVLPLNPETGKLGEPSSTIPTPNPICLLFPAK